MLRLNLSAENIRELGRYLADGICDVDAEEFGGELVDAALRDYDATGFERERVYRQSVGSFVIVQTGTAAERDAWDNAIERHWADVSGRAKQAVAQQNA
jgi:hypothetical protein